MPPRTVQGKRQARLSIITKSLLAPFILVKESCTNGKPGGLRGLHKWSNEIADAPGKVEGVSVLRDMPNDGASDYHRVRLPGDSRSLLCVEMPNPTAIGSIVPAKLSHLGRNGLERRLCSPVTPSRET
jgi:hypothetical protein